MNSLKVKENMEVGMMNGKRFKHGLKRMMGMMLTACMLGTCLVGCGGTSTIPGGDTKGQEGNRETDNSKTQLVVATFDGGLGTSWIWETAARFEEKYKDVSFEEGKTGVQVSVVKSGTYGGDVILSSLQYETADVWFTEDVDYYAHINAGNFADISDIVTEELTEYGESRSIEDKIDDDYCSFLNAGTKEEPKYYAIPFYDGFYGLTYDKDIFAEHNLYFKTSGTENGDAADSLEFVSSASDKKSAGVDGVYGTYDDGLPATYAQFLKMIGEMVKKDITPFIYGGSNSIQYPVRAMASFWAQAEGADGYRLNVTFDGTADNLVKLDSNGKMVMGADGTPQLETLEITESNGYELQRQVSKYNVLQLFHEILNNPKNYSESSMMHTAAQSNFLKGKDDNYATYGMLIDGSWWVNEADDSFSALANRLGEDYEKENRNLAFMPLPVANAEDVGKGSVLLNSNTSLAFVRSNTNVMDCAKAFLQFSTTDAELSAFTASVSMTRSFDYKISSDYENKLTPYGKSIYELKNDSTVIYPYSTSKLFQNNQSFFSIDDWAFGTVLGSTQYTNPWQLWVTYKDRGTTEEYFEGMYQNQKKQWEALSR